jgi:anti-sigma factor RsiW
MTNTTCNDARLMMSEALDGCLDEMRVSAVNEHVRTCAACRERWYALRHVSNLFHSAGLASPAPDFTLRVMQRLGRQQERERSVGTYGGRPLALAWAATSLLLVLPHWRCWQPQAHLRLVPRLSTF